MTLKIVALISFVTSWVLSLAVGYPFARIRLQRCRERNASSLERLLAIAPIAVLMVAFVFGTTLLSIVLTVAAE